MTGASEFYHRAPIHEAGVCVIQVEAAEELFEVLTHPSISRRKVPILIACNKMDLETEVRPTTALPS